MTTCFIKWDNSYSYKLANPDNNFSIINVQGVPQKIIWDGGGYGKEHIINNPDNYSYSFQPRNAWSCTIILGGGTYPISYSGQKIFQSFGFFRYSAPLTFFPCDPEPDFVYKPAGYIYYHFYAQFTDGSLQRYTPWDSYFGGGFSPGQFSYKRNNFISSNNQYSIKIKDNGVTSIYPITNTNSVEIIYSSGGKKIQIEGKQFDIINENSAYKDCSNHCPNGLIECQCGNQLCCYKKTNSGYELIKTINL